MVRLSDQRWDTIIAVIGVGQGWPDAAGACIVSAG
jgi:hypothetical protein